MTKLQARHKDGSTKRATVDVSRNELSGSFAHAFFKERCAELLAANGYRAVCDIGGGKRPRFSLDEIRDLAVNYTVLDISQRELDQLPLGYRTICADICNDRIGEPATFDFMFSRMLAEHVKSGEAMHRNVYRLLRPGGVAFHFFPTLFYPAAIVNLVMPEWLSSHILYAVFPQRRGSKFPARYSRCFGPTVRMHKFLSGIGYEVLEYRPFYGTEYFEKLPVLGWVDTRFSQWAAERRNPYLTSFAYVLLRKPG